MPAAAPPPALQWFRAFAEEFARSTKDPSTEVGIHYLKWSVRGSESATDTEWTYLMGVFLSRLARKMGYFQDWGRVDFAWYEEDRRTPTIAIEHENWYKGIEGSEIPKLISHKAKLKILVTYNYAGRGESFEQVMNGISKIVTDALSRQSPSGEFLLIVGEDHHDEPWRWYGFIWDGIRLSPIE